MHAVFQALTPFGDVYAAISDWLVDHHSHGWLPVVPLIVHLPDEHGDLRDELQISRTTVVFGRHGAVETFDVPFVHDVVAEVAATDDDRYFVLLNTERFADHPRIIHLDATSDVVRKTRFINTCDAILHARVDGETFGLAVGKFSLRNKPVLTWLGGTFHIGLMLWCGFSATVGLVHNRFSDKPISVWVIDAGYELTVIAPMSVVIELWSYILPVVIAATHRPAMHPASRRCSSVKCSRHFFLLAPGDPGASPPEYVTGIMTGSTKAALCSIAPASRRLRAHHAGCSTIRSSPHDTHTRRPARPTSASGAPR